jgi:hypothetical protein
LAGAGSAIQLTGEGIEIFTNFVSGEPQKGIQGVANQVADKIIDKAIEAILPGLTPNMSKNFREAVKNVKEITKNATNITKAVVEKQYENKNN